MEARISDIEDIKDRNLETMQREEERDMSIKNKWSLQELSDSIRMSNIKVKGIPEKKREKRVESLFKQIVEKFPNLWKELVLKSQKQTEHLVTSIQRDLL